jgi:hypothetical protein
MIYNRCGRSGLQLPAISLGLWHNFGHDTPHATKQAICRSAFDHGITHFDLANNYGPPAGSAVAAGSAAVVGGTTAHLATRDSAPAAVVRPAADSDDYSVAGFPKAAQVHDFIQELQARTSVRDAAGVARLIGFPLRVNRSGQPTQIADAAEFTAAFDTLFPQSVAGMVLKCPRSRLFASSQGVMIGTGEVWIAPREAADGRTVPRIIAINIE